MKALYALAVIASAAQAQVPLATPAQNPGQVAALMKLPYVASAAAVKVNPYALDSGVITLPVEGKVYTFVGKHQPPTPPYVSINGQLVENKIDTWSGSSGKDHASFTREGTKVMGSMVINDQNYRLDGGALIKTRAVPPTAKEIAEEQRNDAAIAKQRGHKP